MKNHPIRNAIKHHIYIHISIYDFRHNIYILLILLYIINIILSEFTCDKWRQLIFVTK